MKIILKRQIHQESLDPFGIVQRKQYPFFINSNRLVKFICWVSSVFSPNTAKSTSSPGFNLAGHHFDNREAPREDAKLKSEHKKVIKHVRLYSNENSFIFSIAIFLRHGLTYQTYSAENDWLLNICGILMYTRPCFFKNSSSLLNKQWIIAKGRLPKGSCELRLYVEEQ